MAGNKRKKTVKSRPMSPRRAGRVGTALDETPQGGSFPIVGIGASAGGLEAFTKLLHKLPADTGMAFVLIQHQDPNHESILASLLSRATSMPVQEVAHKMH